MNPTPTQVADTAFGRIEYLDRGQGRPLLVLRGSPGGHLAAFTAADSDAVQARIAGFLRRG